MLIITWLVGHIITQNKLWRIISTALAILIKHQPVSLWQIWVKHHITFNNNIGIILIQTTCLMSYNRGFIPIIDIPTQQGVLVIQIKIL